MYGRRTAALLVALALITGLYLLSGRPESADAAEMCEPVTIDILFPTTTLPPPTTSPPAPETTAPPATTVPAAPTTTVAETTTTAAPETTTTTDDDTTTTVGDTTSTTTPDTTTTTVAETTTTAAPETTTTTVPEPSITAAPETTTTTVPPPPACEPFVYDMAWPLAGDARIGSPFGADRDGGARRHLGNDIAAPKLMPVLAVADGVVARVIRDQGISGSYAVIQHNDGWQSYYIHLNNDLYGTDDGLGVGVRPDLAVGTPVASGEVIGWVGDSGNAENTIPHLHFELRTPEGDAVDPGPSLVAAHANTELATTQPHWPYADDDGNTAEEAAALLLTQGVLLTCDGSAVNFCPDEVAGPDLAAAIADHFAGKTTPRLDGRHFRDPAIAGCPPIEDCALLQGLTEADVASLAVWIRIDALVSTLRPKTATEDTRDVMLPSSADADEQLRSIGAREFCNPPLDEARVLTRGQVAHLLANWMSGVNPEPCRPRGL